MTATMPSETGQVVTHADISMNTELSVIELLSTHAVECGKCHRIILMIELGDMREGILPSDLGAAVARIVSDGGGVNCVGGGVVENCIIVQNTSSDDGAGIQCRDGGTVRNSLIVGNVAGDKGGGVYSRESGVMENCTIVNNRSKDKGGGLYVRDGSTARNCIIYLNSATNSGDNVYSTGTAPVYESCCTDSELGGAGSITNVPAFANAGANDFNLQQGSDCIDAGTTTLNVTLTQYVGTFARERRPAAIL